MKKKQLKVIHPTIKDVAIYKPLECLNYIKPNLNYGPKGLSNFGFSLPGSKNNDEDMRERYRI